MRVNRKVSIWKHVRLADGKWRYCRPVLDAKGKIVSDMVILKGREKHHAEGNYVISFYNPKLTWQRCGRKPADAVVAAERQRALFKAMEHGIVERPKKSQTTGTIDEAVTAYLEELQAKVGNGSKRPQTHAASKQILRSSKPTANAKARRVYRRSPSSTCSTMRAGRTSIAPRNPDVPRTEIHPREPVPQGTGNLHRHERGCPEVPEEPTRACLLGRTTRGVFAACSPRQRTIFKTFQMAGLRESELVFLTFDRLHLDRGVIRIDENPKYDFMPKAYQCRDVYIPPELVEELRKVKPMAGCGLVFPTRNGTPNDKLLIMCKRIAKERGHGAGRLAAASLALDIRDPLPAPRHGHRLAERSDGSFRSEEH